MRALAIVVTGVVCLLLPACSSGPKSVKVTGKITNNDKTIKLPTGSRTQVMFISLDEGGQRYAAVVNRQDFSFEVTGTKGDGIPPGKYRISVQQSVPDSPPEYLEMNKRFSQENSPIIREVPAEDAVELKIDLGKEAK